MHVDFTRNVFLLQGFIIISCHHVIFRPYRRNHGIDRNGIVSCTFLNFFGIFYLTWMPKSTILYIQTLVPRTGRAADVNIHRKSGCFEISEYLNVRCGFLFLARRTNQMKQNNQKKNSVRRIFFHDCKGDKK